jgi:uncharacterized protein YbaP (TraB family)
MLLAPLFVALMVALAQPVAAQSAPKEISPALFVARDADSTLYLFGTVHVRRPGGSWGGRDARAALAESDEVWTEVEMTPDADARAQALMVRHGMAPPDRPLSSWLSAEENERLRALMQRLGAPPHVIEAMQPWLAAITLSVLPMIQAGYDPNAGVDREIDAAAGAAGKRMRAFETIEEQIGFLSGFSPEMQRQILLDAIAETEKGPRQLDALSIAWEQGDLDLLEEYVIDDMREEYPELYDVLFVRRNAAWMETLVRELDGAGVDFVAVGTGHLLGEHGLVAQLRARGVRVERVGAE